MESVRLRDRDESPNLMIKYLKFIKSIDIIILEELCKRKWDIGDLSYKNQT